MTDYPTPDREEFGPRLADEPMVECEDWLYQIVMGRISPVEQNWKWLLDVDVRLPALALLANPALWEPYWKFLLRDALNGDEDYWSILYFATVLDGDGATVKAVIHEVVERCYALEARRYGNG